MSTTRNILSSSLFAMPFLGYQPVNISNGEPAMQAANIVKQTMLSPPFIWPWNRGDLYVDVDPTATSWTQDNIVTIPDFGFLEMGWLIDINGKVKEIEVRKKLAPESAEMRPQSLAAQRVDEYDDVLIRLNAIPDEYFSIGGHYQKQATPITSLASQWAPIPDSHAYIYDWGFLAMVSMILKDARFPLYWQKFTSHLLGAQDGLTALQRNIFLGNWLEVLTAQERATGLAQQGMQARSS